MQAGFGGASRAMTPGSVGGLDKSQQSGEDCRRIAHVMLAPHGSSWRQSNRAEGLPHAIPLCAAWSGTFGDNGAAGQSAVAFH